MVFLKCLDFADRYQGVGNNIFPLMVIEGPNEPSDMSVYLRIIADDFKKFGPQGQGFEVYDPSTNSTGCHKALLVELLGDTPARKKFGGFVGHGGHVACPYCVMNANTSVGYLIRYWKGFNAPVRVDV